MRGYRRLGLCCELPQLVLLFAAAAAVRVSVLGGVAAIIVVVHFKGGAIVWGRVYLSLIGLWRRAATARRQKKTLQTTMNYIFLSSVTICDRVETRS